ncbi:MAG: TIGR04283 family arsenosugar biosynthesis glycosyltransferase [Hyphomicrobiales bacterium]
MLSVVFPTLNAANSIGGAQNAIGVGGMVSEIVVADGGSTDETCKIAKHEGAKIVNGAKGRGAQLAAGAKAATGNWLLFLHADTQLEPGWQDEVRAFIEETGKAQKAAVFRFKLNDDGGRARALEAIVSARCAVLGLPYGDQGLLISKEFYEQLGGFNEIPLMEDVDFVRRIGRNRLHYFEHSAVTSAERYKREGYLKRMMRNAACLTMFFAGVKPERILSFYQ